MNLNHVLDKDAIRPEFIRLPKAGTRCPYTGLSRSSLNELLLASPANDFKPPVRSVVQKKRYATRGIRLIHFASLINHLESLGDKVHVVDSDER